MGKRHGVKTAAAARQKWRSRLKHVWKAASGGKISSRMAQYLRWMMRARVISGVAW
jgi:hypothetical protein